MGLVLLLGDATLMTLSVLDIVFTTTLEDIISPLSVAVSLGLGALAGLWRALKLEWQKLLCELVVAHCEEQSASEMLASEKEPVVT